jgi:hypothetical protein
MSWGAVTNIGTGAAAAAATIIVPIFANQISPAVVVVAAWDLGGTPATGAVTDTRGNTYTRFLTLGGLAVYASNNSQGILNTNGITYTKVDGVSAAEVTACYSVNTSGFFLDTAVTATNTATSSTPTVTGGTASMRGNLYFGICANASSRTFTQDAGNGWASPPSDTGVNNAIDLAGGSKTSTGLTAQTFAPTLSGSTPWNVAIFAFVSADLFSYHEPLTTPTKHLVKSRYHAVDSFSRNAAYFGVATSPFLRDWYKPLTEPVRIKAPLPRGAYGFQFLELPTVSYRLCVTETGDLVRFTVSTYTSRNLAHVAISEIKPQAANVTIAEIRKDRRYS